MFGNSSQSHGPDWNYLPHNLQVNLLQYLFGIGIRPELGLCVEYLSWYREQRLYMGWLRDLYSLLNQNKQFPTKYTLGTEKLTNLN